MHTINSRLTTKLIEQEVQLNKATGEIKWNTESTLKI